MVKLKGTSGVKMKRLKRLAEAPDFVALNPGASQVPQMFILILSASTASVDQELDHAVNRRGVERQAHINANDQLRAETITANTTLRGDGAITGATTVNGTVSRNTGESNWMTKGWPIPQGLFNSP